MAETAADGPRQSQESFQYNGQSQDNKKTEPFSFRSSNDQLENTVFQMASKPLRTQQLVLRPRQLSIEDIGFIRRLATIEGENFRIQTSSRGYKLRTSVTVSLAKILALRERGLADYILNGLSTERPRLIPIVIDNNTMIELARNLLRKYSASPLSLYAYCNDVVLYCKRLENKPDDIMADAKTNRRRIEQHRKFLDAQLADLQDAGRSPGRLRGFAKHIRAWYRVNSVELRVQNIPRPRPAYKDRAPTQQEIARLDMFAPDLEAGMIPVHVHVEANITKGHYADFDTFLGHDAIQYLREYLDARRKGIRVLGTLRKHGLTIKPEEICDNSPLLRDEQHYRKHHLARAISRKQIYQIIHQLYLKAGLLQSNIRNSGQRQYSLRVHSLRKFFKTQLVTRGVPEPVADYFMGHVNDTYTDIQSQGIERLRQTYAGAGLSIHPRSEDNLLVTSLIQQLRVAGKDPEKYLRKEALAEPHRIVVGNRYSTEEQAKALLAALSDYVTDRIAAKE